MRGISLVMLNPALFAESTRGLIEVVEKYDLTHSQVWVSTFQISSLNVEGIEAGYCIGSFCLWACICICAIHMDDSTKSGCDSYMPTVKLCCSCKHKWSMLEYVPGP